MDLATQLRLIPEQGHIWLGEQRAFLLQLPAFAAFRKRLIHAVGVPQARYLLAHMGFITGATDARRARQVRGSRQDAFQAGPLFHAMEGITHPETVRMEIDPARGHFYIEQIWHDSLEASTWPAHLPASREPVCWMQTGHACGFNSTFFGQEIQFREVECRAMGHDHCRIIGKTPQMWQTPAPVFTPAVAVPFSGLVGRDPAFLHACRQAEKIASREVTVLLRGESGVGKERFARLLHQLSPRVRGPFVAVNCAAIPDNLIESELFGVEKGAFTGANRSRAGYFEQASGGTLLLDEIGALSASAQDKLLRVLQEREVQRLGGERRLPVDIRLLAATNARLEEAVREGRFREDLFFRINVVPLVIPALRERPRDISLLIRYFFRQYTERHQRQIAGFTPGALRTLLSWHYPGNVRELENIIERGVVLAEEGQRIGLAELMIPEARRTRSTGISADPAPLLQQWLDNHSLNTLVDTAVQRALVRAEGNISQAARLLGLTRRQLEHRLKKSPRS
ncbi:sigma-54-dependent Fis family transcriptional regulator [Shimwellia blattae]|uniref:sigma-54-dependent Fis family transcriptional regulator n=1 Tax=Shimwellia blattae TaxID=563 RepID=UPI0002DFCFBA|nr:sigma-54-dependent Fis family transcriptional regulator [Shimwellia blattae]